MAQRKTRSRSAAAAPAEETAEVKKAAETAEGKPSADAAAKPAKRASGKVASTKSAEKSTEGSAAAKPAKKTAASKSTKKPSSRRKTASAAKAAASVEETPAVQTAAETPAAPAAAETPAVQTAVETPAAPAETTAVQAAAETPAAPAETEAAAAPEVPAASAETPAAPVQESAAPEVSPAPAQDPAPAETPAAPAAAETPADPAPAQDPAPAENPFAHEPRRSVAFIGSECVPFVKTGGLGDVMYALPRELVRMNCDVRVILPRYECIPWKYQEKMTYRGEFYMDLGATGRNVYIGIMEYVEDGVVYDFIDNQEFFSGPKPYYDLVGDIPKFCLFSKAALAALNFLNWIPDIVHCHDWQAALVPVYLRTLFADTPVGRAKSILTIHNLRFQGIYNIDTIKYWSGLPDYVFTDPAQLGQNWLDANMLKGGLAYADRITTVSPNYAGEIQTWEYGEGLDAHLRFNSWKLRGIVNGIDYDTWNPETDPSIPVHYSQETVIEGKKADKLALQKELGLAEGEGTYVIGLISRLTNQKGLDLVNTIAEQVLDEFTQIVVLGTGDSMYEDSFRYYENTHRGRFAACIQYDEARAHRIYAGADALLVPSRFEPCGLTQLNAMHYGTVPIVRETGGLKDTVQPYNQYTNQGNGFTFDRYEPGLLLDAINRSKTMYFTDRERWNDMILRDMQKDVSWKNSARQYKDLYLELTPW